MNKHLRGVIPLTVGGKCERFKHLSIILGLFALCVLTLVAVYGVVTNHNTLRWEDDFDVFDRKKWLGEKGDEEGYYKRDKRSSYVKNGTLHLRAELCSNEVSDKEVGSGYQNTRKLEPCLWLASPGRDCLFPAYSTGLYTRDSFDIRMGRVEVRARFPSGDWIRAGIALFPYKTPRDGRPSPGKITIAEGCGDKNLTACGGNTVRQSLRWIPENAFNTSYYNITHWETELPSGNFSDDFHVFEVEWTGTKITFSIDGYVTGKFVSPRWEFNVFGGLSLSIPEFCEPWFGGSAPPPFDHPFYMALTLSVGWNFPELEIPSPNRTGEIYENCVPVWDRPELEVDYVRVYKYWP